MAKVNVVFNRSGTFMITGGAVVDVDDPNDWEAIEEAARRQEFVEYLPTSVEYDDEDWEFEKVEDAPED